MKRNLSSPTITIFYKFIFSTVWIVGFGIGTIKMLASRQDEGWGFLIAWAVSTFFIYLYCIRLKTVKIDGDTLIISNFFRKTKVPFTEIKSVYENIFINLHPIFITFRNKTVFGEKILFAPKGTYIFQRHPVVKELKEKIR